MARIPCEIVRLLEKAGFRDVTTEISYTGIASKHEKPEHYLDANYQDGQSTFHLLSEKDISNIRFTSTQGIRLIVALHCYAPYLPRPKARGAISLRSSSAPRAPAAIKTTTPQSSRPSGTV